MILQSIISGNGLCRWLRSGLCLKQLQMIGVTSTLFVGIATAGQAGTIDDFDATSFSGAMLVAPGSVMHTDVGLPGVAGGTRQIVLNATTAGGMINSVGFEISGSTATYGTGPSAEGTLELRYDGASLAADLGGAPDTLWIDFLRFDDAGNAGLDVTVVVSDGVNSASRVQTLTTPSLSPFSWGFQLAMFSGIAGVDLGNLQSIAFTFDGRMGQDFQIDAIRAVSIPEPRALTLAGIGGLLLAGWTVIPRLRRRRHRC